MPDVQSVTEPENIDPPVRYVLQRLPDPHLENLQRQQHHRQQFLDRAMFAGMLFMVVWAMGMIVFEVAYGNASTVSMAALLLMYSVLLAWTVFRGNVGVRGRYHQVHAHNCVIALEDDQREIFGYDKVRLPLGNIPAELVPEYLRLLRVAEEAQEYLERLRNRLDEIKFHGLDPEGIVDTGSPGPAVREDHVD